MTTFENALRLIDEWIGPEAVAGAAAAVWYRGNIVAERYAGEAQPGLPVDERTLFALASVTKPITAATVMSLVEDGLISLDESVVRFVPEFSSATADATNEPDPALEALRPTITVRHLLSHTAGLPEDAGPRRVRYRDEPDLATIVDAMCRLPLQSAPEAELRYSNAGYGILTRLAEHITGEPLWDTVQRHVLGPLGLNNIVARPCPSLAERLVHVQDPAARGSDVESYNSAYWRDLALPWAGLFGSARDLATFAAAFLPGGRRLVAPATAALMTTDQANGVPGGVESAKVHWPVARWGLGWEIKGDKRNHWTGDLTSPHTFCHWGQAGTLLWADPAHDLALAVFANRTVIQRWWPFVPARWARLSNAVIASINTP